jgi:glucans biosynthesis protein C
MTPTTRIDYMDAARSVLMLLGVVLHSAHIYAAGTSWLVKDIERAPLLTWVIAGIHLFRMPAFFFISGFFCALTLERYGSRRFLRRRLPRLLLPLLTVALLINIPQAMWLAANGLAPGPGALGWLKGTGWVFHLWFLLNLVVYFALAAAVGPAVARWIRAAVAAAPPGRAGGFAGALALFAAATALYLVVAPLAWLGWLYEPLPLVGTPWGLVRYGCTFAVGFAAMADPRLADGWVRRGWFAIPLAVVATAAAPRLPGAAGELAGHIAVPWRDLAAAWTILLLFRRLAVRPSVGWRYLSDASYTIYLLHHPIVLVMGLVLLSTALPVGLKFAAVCGTAVALSLIVHHFLVLRVPVAALLLNGRLASDRIRAGGRPPLPT